jgi:hypothetical protein
VQLVLAARKSKRRHRREIRISNEDPRFAQDPITLVCLLAAFACGLGAWADLLTPALLDRYGRTVAAVVVHTEARALPHGGHDDFVSYRFRIPPADIHQKQERVPTLAAFGLPKDGSTVFVRYLPALPFVCRLQGNDIAGIATWLLGASVVMGLAGVGNFRQWRYGDRSRR